MLNEVLEPYWEKEGQMVLQCKYCSCFYLSQDKDFVVYRKKSLVQRSTAVLWCSSLNASIPSWVFLSLQRPRIYGKHWAHLRLADLSALSLEEKQVIFNWYTFSTPGTCLYVISFVVEEIQLREGYMLSLNTTVRSSISLFWRDACKWHVWV